MRTVATGVLMLALCLLPAGTAAADPSPDAWARLRTCEASGDYTIVSPDGGYYGAYQFDLTTWQSVGGAGLPNQATPAEQDYRALYLYRMRGWQPWTCARTLGLQPDADAASQRVPTEADAAAMNPPTGPAPATAAHHRRTRTAHTARTSD